MSIVQGTGVKVGESTTIYPVVGLETGFISNVFYDDSNPIGAGILRVLGRAGVGSLPVQAVEDNSPPETNPNSPSPDQPGLQYRADLYAAYDQYLSSNNRVLDQGGLSGGLVFRALGNGGHPIFVTALEHFERVIRATNFESNHDTNRDINTLDLRLNYQRLGRAFGGYLFYQHNLDLFEEDTQQFADRFDNTFGLHIQYQWLPLTRVYVEGSIGVFGGVGSSSTKVSSYPVVAVAGIQTALTTKTNLAARFGYTQGNYASGPDYQTVTGGLQVSYRYSPLGRLLAMYDYSSNDSINANFYQDHAILAMIAQQVLPFDLFARPELRFRHYGGVLQQIMTTSENRDDVIFAVTAGLAYNFRSWIAASLEYRFATDQTDFRYSFNGIPDDPSYVRHEVLIGVRGAL